MNFINITKSPPEKKAELEKKIKKLEDQMTIVMANAEDRSKMWKQNLRKLEKMHEDKIIGLSQKLQKS